MDLKSFLLVLCLFVTACVAPAVDEPAQPIEYAGILVGNTTWDGVVVLADDVIVPRGSLLQIMPGTKVLVRTTQSTKIEPEQLSPATELLVRGRLVARGSSAEPIEFVDTAADDLEIAWAGVIADRAEAVYIDHVKIRRAEQGLWLVGTPGIVQNTSFESCRYGMVFQEPAELVVSENSVTGGEAAIFCWRGATPELVANTIRGQVEEGVFIDAQSRPRLQDNLIEGNGVGLVAAEADFSKGNVIRANNVDFMPLGGNP